MMGRVVKCLNPRWSVSTPIFFVLEDSGYLLIFTVMKDVLVRKNTISVKMMYFFFLKYLVFSLQFSLSIFLWNPKIFQAKFFRWDAILDPPLLYLFLQSSDVQIFSKIFFREKNLRWNTFLSSTWWERRKGKLTEMHWKFWGMPKPH